MTLKATRLSCTKNVDLTNCILKLPLIRSTKRITIGSCRCFCRGTKEHETISRGRMRLMFPETQSPKHKQERNKKKPQSRLKKTRLPLFFKPLSSRCFDILVKHSSSCLILHRNCYQCEDHFFISEN